MKRYGLLSLLVLIGILTACEHKELCFDHPHTADLRVIFDWRYAPDARPSSMRLYLFPKTEKEPLVYEFTDRTGGTVTVPAGHYRALCLNSNTEFILYRNAEHYESFEAYLTEGAFPRPVPRNGQSIRAVPDMLWDDRAEEVEVVASREGQTLTLYPKIVVRHYTVEIINAGNLEYISSGEIFGSLTGMSGGFMLGEDTPTDELATLPFDMTSDGKTTVKADFYTFGYPPASETPQSLVVYAVLNDGKKYSFAYDVTAKIHEAPDPMNVHIVLDGLPLPKPIDDDSGFNPNVDEWNTEEIEISM